MNVKFLAEANKFLDGDSKQLDEAVRVGKNVKFETTGGGINYFYLDTYGMPSNPDSKERIGQLEIDVYPNGGIPTWEIDINKIKNKDIRDEVIKVIESAASAYDSAMTKGLNKLGFKKK
jgi:hypothetical protein